MILFVLSLSLLLLLLDVAQVFQNGCEMVPMQLCTPDTEHFTGTEYTGEVHNAWPLPQPQKRKRKAPAAQGVIDPLNA